MAIRPLMTVSSRLVTNLLLSQMATLALALALLHGVTGQILRLESRHLVQEVRSDLMDEYRLGGEASLVAQMRRTLDAVDSRDMVLLLADADGGKIIGNLSAWPATFSGNEPWRVMRLYRTGAMASESMGLESVTLRDGRKLLLGRVLDDESVLTSASAKAFLYALLLGAVLSVINVALAMRVLRSRVGMLSQAAQAFRGGDHDRRIAREEWGTGFSDLADEMNRLLDHNQRLIGELRMVADSLAHDLRTPVTRMQATLEQGLSATRDPAAIKALGGAMEEAGQLHAMLSTSLEISRAEAGIGLDQFTRFDLEELLRNIAEVYGPLAEDMGWTIEIDAPSPCIVMAHKDLLTRAISNLIDNALKHAKDGHHVVLTARRETGNRILVTVADDGPGIAPDRIEEAMRRFGRLDAARTMPGAGLGLSLAATIARLHDGEFRLEPNQPKGLRAVLDMGIADLP